MRRLVGIVFAFVLVSSFLAFPSDAGAYAPCNCTAWAKQKRPDLPMNLGHAKTWGVRAKAQGYPVDGKPRVGDVIVLQPGVQGAHRRYGHVAYVIGVSGNRITVSQMNGGRGCVVSRDTFRITRGVAFIHPKVKKAAKVAVAAPKKETKPAATAPKKETKATPVAPKKEAKPATATPKKEAKPATAAPKTETKPAATAPQKQAKPAEAAPKKEPKAGTSVGGTEKEVAAVPVQDVAVAPVQGGNDKAKEAAPAPNGNDKIEVPVPASSGNDKIEMPAPASNGNDKIEVPAPASNGNDKAADTAQAQEGDHTKEPAAHGNDNAEAPAPASDDRGKDAASAQDGGGKTKK